MKSKMKVHVTFRNSIDLLTSMFIETYDSVKAAKEAIEYDAAFFVKRHKYHGGPVGMKFTQKSKWVNPKSEDYFMARGQDGCTCYWQYFVEH